jgi:hypothetical protein
MIGRRHFITLLGGVAAFWSFSVARSRDWLWHNFILDLAIISIFGLLFL